jgi:hypothetical protein
MAKKDRASVDLRSAECCFACATFMRPDPPAVCSERALEFAARYILAIPAISSSGRKKQTSWTARRRWPSAHKATTELEAQCIGPRGMGRPCTFLPCKNIASHALNELPSVLLST